MDWRPESYISCMITTGFGLGLLERGFHHHGAQDGMMRIWTIIFLPATLQMTTALRPLVGTASTLLPATNSSSSPIGCSPLLTARHPWSINAPRMATVAMAANQTRKTPLRANRANHKRGWLYILQGNARAVCLLELLPTSEEDSLHQRGTEGENCVVPCHHAPPVVVGLYCGGESMGINDLNAGKFAKAYQPKLSG